MLYLAMAIGSCMIMAMSAWLNAAALAGAAALEQHMSITTEEYQSKLNEAHERTRSRLRAFFPTSSWPRSVSPACRMRSARPVR